MSAKQKHKCLICNSGFSTKGALKKHEDNIHNTIRFDCKDCGKQFTQWGSLGQHVKSVHKGMKYKCDQHMSLQSCLETEIKYSSNTLQHCMGHCCKSSNLQSSHRVL